MRIVKLIVILLVLLIVAAVGSVYLAPQKAFEFATGAERLLSGLERKAIDLPEGFRYVYLDGGRGEPLMLLHGFGANKDNFVRVARYLTPHYRVIVPDHIGFGESSHPRDADYAPIAQARRLHAFAQALGLKRLHLGGSSMGGHIALTYAALYPTEVASLWLLDPSGVWSAGPSELEQIERAEGQNPLLVRSEDDFARLYGYVMNDPPFIPRPLLNVLARERIPYAELEERILKQIRTDSVEARARGLTIPALIVWGDKDRALNVGAAGALHRLLPRSELVIMGGVGHLPMLERPRQSADDYLQFRGAR